jgi:hypothetical protein
VSSADSVTAEAGQLSGGSGDGRDGRKVLDLPINAGVIMTVIAPMLTAAGAAPAVAGGWHVIVEHRVDSGVPLPNVLRTWFTGLNRFLTPPGR